MASLSQRFRSLGPGIILAASGIGAGDVVVASVTGIRHGMNLLWAVVFTAALKYALTESLARWQLATGETVVRAWVTRFPRWVSVLFGGYLLFWTFMVGASLSSACGLVGATVFPALSVPAWGAIHAILAAGLVAANRYAQFQRVMKALVAVMALSVLGCAVLTRPDPSALLQGLLVPLLPERGGGAQVLALLGGIGGSVTVICYAYWMRAVAWRGHEKLATMRGDVRLAYLFTGLFGVSLVVVAAGVQGSGAGGTRMALEIAERLQGVGGIAARWVFLLGFWCTVTTAMLGVWQGVPQIYVDLWAAWRDRELQHGTEPITRDARTVYLAALAYLAGPPLILLWHKEPVAVVVAFSIAGAFFMPFLAATLLYLNNRRAWVGDLANRWLGNAALGVSLLVFGVVCAAEVLKALSR